MYLQSDVKQHSCIKFSCRCKFSLLLSHSNSVWQYFWNYLVFHRTSTTSVLCIQKSTVHLSVTAPCMYLVEVENTTNEKCQTFTATSE